MFKYFSFFNLFKIPIAPLILGLGGTLPFIFLSIVIWLGSSELQLIALFNLINYSIIILIWPDYGCMGNHQAIKSSG